MKIVSDYAEYMFNCYTYGIYQDRINMIFNPENVINEFIICKDMLDKEFNPPIKVMNKKESMYE